MKFVILIHSNPQPWGRPTSAHTAAYRALPQDVQDALGAHWEKVFGEADAKGEIVYGAPSATRRRQWWLGPGPEPSSRVGCRDRAQRGPRT